jgi:hypothetical protein
LKRFKVAESSLLIVRRLERMWSLFKHF